jgi:predicted transcriptional regulator
MNLQEEKLNVLQHIINSDDVDLIKDIKSLISNRDMDWFDTLSKAQQNNVAEGINQLDNGNFFSHEEAKKRFGYK